VTDSLPRRVFEIPKSKLLRVFVPIPELLTPGGFKKINSTQKKAYVLAYGLEKSFLTFSNSNAGFHISLVNYGQDFSLVVSNPIDDSGGSILKLGK